jgi:hypothetical protein
MQSFGKANNYTGGEIFEGSGPGSTSHQMNLIAWVIGAGNAALMEMIQGKPNGIHQDITNQNTALHSRNNYLEQADANQSRQIQNLQKMLEECDPNAIEGLLEMFNKLQGNIGAGSTTGSIGPKIAQKKNENSNQKIEKPKPITYSAVVKVNASQATSNANKNDTKKETEPKPTFKALYPRVERQITIEHKTTITTDFYQASVNTLKLVNSAMTNNKDIASP